MASRERPEEAFSYFNVIMTNDDIKSNCLVHFLIFLKNVFRKRKKYMEKI